jgi:hypothetical protein
MIETAPTTTTTTTTNTKNQVTIYQNGIAAFERTYEVNGKCPIKLPFNRDHIGDVAASLSILGAVEVEAPTYSTQKEKPALSFEPTNATKDLFTKLSGSEVSVTLNGTSAPLKGRVVGYQTENNLLATGQQVTQNFLTIQTSDGTTRRLNFNTEVASYTFTDPKVQSLITKALDYNLEQVNPNSVYLYCSLNAKAPTVADS